MISYQDCDPLLSWRGLTNAIQLGHELNKAEISDTFLYRRDDTLLSRSAWIDGMGIAVKCATIFPGNKNLKKPAINGAVNLFDDKTGQLSAVIDFHLVTKWKTAGDSILAAKLLARPNSRNILILGAGTVAYTLRQAYGNFFPDAHFSVWNRTSRRAEKFAANFPNTMAVNDLEKAISNADIISAATMSSEPLINGKWLKPGQHIDLIGAYRPDMREADDITLKRSKIFVDSFETTIDHIGELKIPIASAAIEREDVLSDFYNIEAFHRSSDDEITLFKNGGGAHLDLMTAHFILQTWLENN
jgi:ornithine cyclodeaminase